MNVKCKFNLFSLRPESTPALACRSHSHSRSLTPDEREMYIQFVVLACALKGKGLPALACRSHSLTLRTVAWVSE